MNRRDIAEAFLAAVNKFDLDAASMYCTDNFTYSGPFPQPVSMQEWKAASALFLNAFPDWQFNMRLEHDHGDMMHISAQITGTHHGDLDLSSLGMQVIPATHRVIRLAPVMGELTFEGDKVANLHIHVVDGAGIPAIVAQLTA